MPYNSKELTKEKNLELYDLLTEKANNDFYKNRPSSQAKVFMNGREKFLALANNDVNGNVDLSKQLEVLRNMLNYFSSNPGDNDFSLIGGSSRAGTVYISDCICNNKNDSTLIIISQSCTGLFEKRKVIR